MRKAFKEPETFAQYEMGEEHIYQCLEMIRQDLMCRADDTPMPSVDELYKIGDGQAMQCRDWNALVAWSRNPGQHSCFESGWGFRTVKRRLEQHTFCPMDSPHYEVMKEYLERHGHKSMFDE